jgi:hypothetical protein
MIIIIIMIRNGGKTISSQTLLTGRWIPISRGAFMSWKFQNGHVAMETVNVCQNI